MVHIGNPQTRISTIPSSARTGYCLVRRHHLQKDSKEAWSSLQRGEGKLNYGKILSDYSQ